jgi:hypothetical protein
MNKPFHSIDDMLFEIDKKSEFIINQRKIKLSGKLITPFDILLNAALSRTVNINKAFVSLIKDHNFIA